MVREKGPIRIPLKEVEQKPGVGRIKLVNRTECRLLQSVAEAFDSNFGGAKFDAVFGRPGTSEDDRKLAQTFGIYHTGLQLDLLDKINHENISDPNGLRKPYSLDYFDPYISDEEVTQDIFGMTLLTALQPEAAKSAHPHTDRAVHTDLFDSGEVNLTIQKARLLTEILIEAADKENLQLIENTTSNGASNPIYALYERYMDNDNRPQMKKSIEPYMESLRENLFNEFFVAQIGSPTGHQEHPEWEYSGSIRVAIMTAGKRAKEYEQVHPRLPWTKGPKSRTQNYYDVSKRI